MLSKGADINAKSSHGDTALIGAVKLQLPNMTSLLLQRGANINVINVAGETALSIAAQGKTTDILQTLLRAGTQQTLRATLR